MNHTKSLMTRTAQPARAGLPPTQALASVVRFDQLSLAADVRIPSWREPVRRNVRAGPTGAPRVAAEEPTTHAAAMATLWSIESRSIRASTWELCRAIEEVRSAGAVLDGADERAYAQCLLLKLQSLVDEKLVRDVALGAASRPASMQ